MRAGAVLAAALALLAGGEAQAAGRLSEIRARGHLVCGVAQPPRADAAATGAGLGVDGEVCRAVAASLFGAPDRVQFRPVADLRAFAADPDIDIVAHNLTWTLSRTLLTAGRFAAVVLDDGQGFLVRSQAGIATAADLGARAVCVHAGGEAALNLAAYARRQGVRFQIVEAEDLAQAGRRFLAGDCAALSADLTELAAVLRAAPKAGDFEVLAEVVSSEPIAPVVRGDEQFLQVVNWTIFALIQAEALGVTAANVDSRLAQDDLATQRLLRPGAVGAALGLGASWSVDAIRGVGNYGEVFARALGPLLATRQGRGLNRPWTQGGGTLYAPPFR